MSWQMVKVVTCDGCGRTDGAVAIAKSRPANEDAGAGDEVQTVDLCTECDRAGRIICRNCGGVHEADEACPEIAEEHLGC